MGDDTKAHEEKNQCPRMGDKEGAWRENVNKDNRASTSRYQIKTVSTAPEYKRDNRNQERGEMHGINAVTLNNAQTNSETEDIENEDQNQADDYQDIESKTIATIKADL